MFEHFTDRARRVVVFAHEEAARLGSDHIQSEHLLFGLLAEGQSGAARALIDRGIKREGLAGIARQVDTIEVADPHPSVQFTATATAVVERARKESESLGHEFVGPEHLLLGMLDTDDGRALKMLKELGPAAQGLREEILELVSQKTGVPGHLGNCSRCGASITEFGKVQEVAIGVEDKGPINVYAYFCGECRSTFGLVKGSDDGPA